MILRIDGRDITDLKYYSVTGETGIHNQLSYCSVIGLVYLSSGTGKTDWLLHSAHTVSKRRLRWNRRLWYH